MNGRILQRDIFCTCKIKWSIGFNVGHNEGISFYAMVFKRCGTCLLLKYSVERFFFWARDVIIKVTTGVSYQVSSVMKGDPRFLLKMILPSSLFKKGSIQVSHCFEWKLCCHRILVVCSILINSPEVCMSL